MQIDLSNYKEKCECGEPARLEFMADEINGVEYHKFCVNPKCWNFDHVWLKQKREILEKAMRQTKSWERYRKRLWKEASRTFAEARKRSRQRTHASMA